MIKTCSGCGKRFSTVGNRRKYCSVQCYQKSRCGKPWGGALTTGRGSKGKYTDYQISRMVDGKKKAYLEKVLIKYSNNEYDISRINDILDNCYVDNIRAMVKMIYHNDDRVLCKEFKYLFEYLNWTDRLCKETLPECYRTMTPEQSKWFKMILSDCSNFYDFSKKFETSYKQIGIRKACRLYKHLTKFINFTGIKTNALLEDLSKNLKGCGSSCESTVRELLIKHNLKYVEQANVSHTVYRSKSEQKDRVSYLRPDFIIDDKFIIEVNGDYWHGYGLEEHQMDKHQLKRHRADIEKYSFYKQKEYRFIIIWEHDLDDIEAVEKQILTEVQNESNFKRIVYK